MYVRNLTLHDFRNFQHLDLALNQGIILLYGANAAGKTSILESLFYLATTRSPRVNSDREMVRWGAQSEAGVAPFARLKAEVQRTNHTLLLEVLIQLKTQEEHHQTATPTHVSSTHKLIRINRKHIRAIDLVGQLRVVLFTPADLVLVEGPPTERRRYLDITLSQLDPHYVRTLARYHKIVQQRNSLLRSWRERRRAMRAVDEELGYWDNELAASASYLLAERLRAVADLNTIVGPLFQEIIGTSEPLEIQYQSSFALDIAADVGEITQRMNKNLQALRQDELNRGQTLIGPHRDDLLFTVGKIDLGVYGSRGQQRSIVLALKLAEAKLMVQRSGDKPILLLDDILSELDAQRRSHVLRTITQPNQQTLLTSTDLGLFDAPFLQQAQCLRVESGKV